MSGQRLFYPPDVSGWDDTRWLDTATFRGRWTIANYALGPYALSDHKGPQVPNDPDAIVEGALKVVGSPTIRPQTREMLLRFARSSLAGAQSGWKAKSYPPLVANAVRQLLVSSPDYQTC
jgi:hypothetical protein